MSRRHQLQVLFVLFFFTLLGILRHLHNYGEDLASSYLGCRLLAAGQGAHLYSHSLTNFSVVGDSVWYDMARRTGYGPLGLVHPYVQTPLWAYSLEPACTHLNFRPFCDGFIVIFMLCSSGIIWLTARYWTPTLMHPGWIALVYAWLYTSEPFKYAIFLAQTHVLYLFMTVAALILAERGRQFWAGVLLALAAAVKITPGFLILYWLLTRRTKAAASFVVTMLVLTGATWLILGSALSLAYFRSLSQNANVLLLAFNNQSLAAWLVGLQAPRSELTKWYPYHLPTVVKLLSMGLTVGSAILGGWFDRFTVDQDGRTDAIPYGAIFAMMGATLGAPIAWTHYYILLVIPVMIMIQAKDAKRSPVLLACAVALWLLNTYPVTFQAVHLYWKPYTLARSQFYAGVLAMTVLATLAYQRRRQPSPRHVDPAGRVRARLGPLRTTEAL